MFNAKLLFVKVPMVCTTLLAAYTLFICTKLNRKVEQFVEQCGDVITLNGIIQNDQFKQLMEELPMLEAPAVLLLNKHALAMTHNWLCNTESMTGVHSKIILVTLDSHSSVELKERWQNIRQIEMAVECLKPKFGQGDVAYQALYLFRANIIRAFLHYNRSVWMLQQDTVCRDDLFRLAAEKDHPDADAVFDQMGFDPNSSRAQVINGANFYVRSTDHSRRLFADVSWWLTHFFVQDIGVLMMHCRSRRGLKCFYFPYKLVSGWEWIASEQRNGPFWMQVDGESDTGGKIDRFKEYGFYFIHDNGSCDAAAVIKARSAIAHGNVPKVISPSKKQHLRAAALAEGAFRLPIIGEYLKTYVLLGIYFIDHLI